MNLIPEGTWRCKGVSYAYGYTSQDGEQVGVELMLLPDQDEDVDGRHITWYGQFSEKAEPFTLKTLVTLGWAGDDLSDLSGIVNGNECEAVIAHEQDLQGEWRARVRFINALGSGGVAMKTKMTEDQVKAFAERMRGRVLAMKSKTASTPSAAPAGAKQPAAKQPTKPKTRAQQAADVQSPDDDNIPF